jgi:hypothetical protein
MIGASTEPVVAFLDPLLGACASLVVEANHALGEAAQGGDDESDAGIQFARMPLDLAQPPAVTELMDTVGGLHDIEDQGPAASRGYGMLRSRWPSILR